MFEGARFEGALDSLREGGVKGRYPPPLTLSPDGLEPDQLEPEDRLMLAGPLGRVVLLFGGVNGRKPPRFPFSADGVVLRCVCTLAGADERGLPLFCRLFEEALGGVNGRYPPRFPFCTVDVGLPALLVGGLFVPRLGAGVPALGLCIVPAAAVPRSPAPLAATRPPACTGVTWLCCMDCCKRAACCWNGTGRGAFAVLPKKCCGPPLRIVDGAAGRPLADKLARVGTTGRFPVIMRAFLNWLCVAATAVALPAPKRSALTVERARPTR